MRPYQERVQAQFTASVPKAIVTLNEIMWRSDVGVIKAESELAEYASDWRSVTNQFGDSPVEVAARFVLDAETRTQIPSDTKRVIGRLGSLHVVREAELDEPFGCPGREESRRERSAIIAAELHPVDESTPERLVVVSKSSWIYGKKYRASFNRSELQS